MTILDIDTLDWNKSPDHLLPVIIQDDKTDEVLMLGYVNEAALSQTISTGRMCFYSRSKQRLWVKGETSGHFLSVKSLLSDCDNDTILAKVEPIGPVCHKGTRSCFGDDFNSAFINHLQLIISDRLQKRPEGAYTTALLEAGIKKIAQKVGEEAVETILEAEQGCDKDLLNESADLIYHLMVLLTARKLTIHDVYDALQKRAK